MKKIKVILLLVVSLSFIGCASTPQPTIPLSQTFYTNKEASVGVYMMPLPKVDTHIVGASCLLCYGIASAANSSLTSHFESLNANDLKILNELVNNRITSKGIRSTLITSDINLKKFKKFKKLDSYFPKIDFRPLKEKLGVSKLVVIDLNTLGAYRPYSAYVPTGDPTGTVMGVVYTIDLATNKYDLYETIDIKINTHGNWDEPPSFPGVSNAYYQAIESAKDKIVSFF